MDTENDPEEISADTRVNVSFAKGADLYATGGKAERGKRSGLRR